MPQPIENMTLYMWVKGIDVKCFVFIVFIVYKM